MKDLETAAHEMLTDRSPSGEDGSGHGAPASAAEPQPPPGAVTPPAEPHAAGPASTGEPDTLPPTWCRKCAATVQPEGKGRCPRCGTFLRLNFVARRHPVNVLRRDALLAKLVADYRPSTTMLQETCTHLAATLERLDATKPGTTEWQRLVQSAQTLAATLDEAHRADVRTPAEGLLRIVREIVHLGVSTDTQVQADPEDSILLKPQDAGPLDLAQALPRRSPTSNVGRTPRGDPELWVGGDRLVTIDDVRNMFADFGEEHIFTRGEFDRDRAFHRAARWLQQQADMGGV